MIGRLKGQVISKQAPDLLLDVQGVGYELLVPLNTFFDIPDVGQTVTLHTHFVVREDAQQLYGFAQIEERTLFRQLIKVNGVGPTRSRSRAWPLRPLRCTCSRVQRPNSTPARRVRGR